MNIKIKLLSNFLILIFAALAVSSCQTDKNAKKSEVYVEDCSMAFFNSGNTGKINIDESGNVTLCKVLPLKISSNTKCEISGSNAVDNFVNYNQNLENISFFRVSLDSLKSDISLRKKIKYYFMIKKFKENVGSDLFDSLKDYKYKGISCSVNNNKFTGWVSGEEIIIAYKDSDKVTKNKSINSSVKKLKEIFSN